MNVFLRSGQGNRNNFLVVIKGKISTDYAYSGIRVLPFMIWILQYLVSKRKYGIPVTAKFGKAMRKWPFLWLYLLYYCIFRQLFILSVHYWIQLNDGFSQGTAYFLVACLKFLHGLKIFNFVKGIMCLSGQNCYKDEKTLSMFGSFAKMANHQHCSMMQWRGTISMKHIRNTRFVVHLRK